MVDTAENIYESGKRSLESILREKAYSEVKEILDDKGININSVSDEDIEVLVATKVEDMIHTLKDLGYAAAFAVALSSLMGA